MKKFIIVFLLILSVIACKKKGMSPEGPTDVRIRNLSDLIFNNVIVRTSTKPEDVDTIGHINYGSTSDYFRFTKAYPKAQISAEISIGGSPVTFSTGTVDFTYMQYIGQDKITYEVNISDYNSKTLTVSNIIEDEPLNLK